MSRSSGRRSTGPLHGLEALEPFARHLRTEAKARERLARAPEGERAPERAERAEHDEREDLGHTHGEQERIKHENARALEAKLFRDAVVDVVPLAPTGRVDPPRRARSASARQREIDERAALAASLSDEIGIEHWLEIDETLSYRRSSVGPEVPRRLRRGEWTIRGQIDLHGLRVDEAREALAAFLDDARRREWRCVRVIHGKGLGSVGREPVLKAKVPRWLAQRREVLAFCQARPNDGGSGAVIVLLG